MLIFRNLLPAGLGQARYVTAHGCLTQLVSAHAELALNTVWTTSHSTTTLLANGASVTWQLLQLDLSSPLVIIAGVRIFQNGLKLGSLGRKLFYGLCALILSG
jgi:hypothetical protein